MGSDARAAPRAHQAHRYRPRLGRPVEGSEGDPIAHALQALAVEVAALGIKLEQETAPALQAAGAMVAGMFGSDMADDADDDLQLLCQRGRELRARFAGETGGT